MKKSKVLLFVIICFLITNSLDIIAAAKPAETTYGDCSSSDTKKHYKSITLVDRNGDGKYDYKITVWCNGERSKKEIQVNNGSGFGFPNDMINYHIDFVDYIEVAGDISYSIEVRHNISNVLWSEGFTDFSNDTLFMSEITSSIQGEETNTNTLSTLANGIANTISLDNELLTSDDVQPEMYYDGQYVTMTVPKYMWGDITLTIFRDNVSGENSKIVKQLNNFNSPELKVYFQSNRLNDFKFKVENKSNNSSIDFMSVDK